LTLATEIAFVSLGIGTVLLLPVIFEYSVRRARFIYFAFAYRMQQHLFPDSVMDPALLDGYLEGNEYAIRIDPGKDLLKSIAKRQNAIRQLTGEGMSGHLRALAEAGRLVSAIAESNRIELGDTSSERPISPERIINELLRLFCITSSEIETSDQLANVMKESPVDIEQVVELLLAVVDLLVGRIEAKEKLRATTS
jgi:hypothetical protein